MTGWIRARNSALCSLSSASSRSLRVSQLRDRRAAIVLARFPGSGQRQPRQLRGRGVQLIEQGPVRRIGDPLPHGRDGVGHGIEDAALALEQDERGQRGGVRTRGRLAQVQRQRPVGALRRPAHERQLLPLRADRQIERQLRLDDRVGPGLEGNRLCGVALGRIHPGDVADRKERASLVGTDRLPDAQRAEVRLERRGIVAGQVIDNRQVGQELCDVRMIGAQDPLPDRQRPRIVRQGRGVVLVLAGDDPEVLVRRGHREALRALEPLADGERAMVEILGAREVTLLLVDQGQIVQQRRVEQAVGSLDPFRDRQRAAVDLLGLLDVADVVADVRQRDQGCARTTDAPARGSSRSPRSPAGAAARPWDAGRRGRRAAPVASARSRPAGPRHRPSGPAPRARAGTAIPRARLSRASSALAARSQTTAITYASSGPRTASPMLSARSSRRACVG